MNKQSPAEALALWYKAILKETNFVLPGPIKGTMFLSDKATTVWRNIQKQFEKYVLKKLSIDVKEVIFPTLIPKSMIEEEKDHIEGFKSELWLTKRKLSNNEVVLRPTSETLFNKYVAQQNLSYLDLPIGYYQWANVFRIEENVKALLRTSEFLWQEGHTFHITEEGAINFSQEILKYYVDFFNDVFLLPTFSGEKTKAEKFAGAKRTYSVETIMKDGQAIQIATTHNLSTNFTKIFNANYITSNNMYKYLHGTSWGFSSRVLGATILMHGDEHGLVFPSQIAANHLTIILINFHKWPSHYQDRIDYIQKHSQFIIKLKNVKKSFGPIKWQEIKLGTPLMISIGERDFGQQETIVNIRFPFNTKMSIKNLFAISIEEFDNQITRLLKVHDAEIKQKANSYWDDKIKEVFDISSLVKSINSHNPVYAYINMTKDEEMQMKKQYGISIRILIKSKKKDEAKCIFTKKGNAKLALIARSY